MKHSVGAFLWDDLDQGQWYEITQIKVLRMNWWILSKGGFIKFLWRAMIRVITDYWSWCGAFQWNSPCESYSSVCEICLETEIREYTVHRTSYFPQIESDYSKAWCKSSIIFYMQHLFGTRRVVEMSSTFCNKICTHCAFYRSKAKLFCGKWPSSRVWRDSA